MAPPTGGSEAATSYERRDLAVLVSAIERGDAAALDRAGAMLAAEPPVVVGVTGPPGAGKSSLLARMVGAWSAEARTAVLLVDPSSPVTGGAVLGDRVRFRAGAEGDRAFVRSLGTRGHQGGLTERLPLVVAALGGAGIEAVVVETVGAGQSEVAIADLADVTLLLCPPGLGDGIQAIKAGAMEVADVLVVSKADRPEAALTLRELEGEEAHRLAPRPVVAVSARSGEGLDELGRIVDELVALRRSDGGRPPGLSLGRAIEVRALAQVAARLGGDAARRRVGELAPQVGSGLVGLDGAARALVASLGLSSEAGS